MQILKLEKSKKTQTNPLKNQYKVSEQDNYWKKGIPSEYWVRFPHHVID